MDVSPRYSRRSPALEPGLGAAFPPAEVRDQALSAFRTQSSDLPKSLHGAKKGRENTSRVPHSPSSLVEDGDHYLYRWYTGE